MNCLISRLAFWAQEDCPICSRQSCIYPLDRLASYRILLFYPPRVASFSPRLFIALFVQGSLAYIHLIDLLAIVYFYSIHLVWHHSVLVYFFH
jgi:hypothetical protein